MKTIIFYNPSAPYYSMPLQFLALAAVVDRSRYRVMVVDARIERNPQAAHDRVRELLPGAAMLGISVITGNPIADAVAVSRLAKAVAPDVPVVWGGWHPSILPEQCLREGGADLCMHGQAELTLLEYLKARESGADLEEIQGISFLRNGEFVCTPDRKFVDIGQFPAYDYGLIPVETYYKLKRSRQLDFYSSQGCPYRCAFCADPFVYNRRWSGLKGSRLLGDVLDVVETFRADDVLFQDENFFANRNRVLEFCEGVRERGTRFTWVATSRADQTAPLDDAFLRTARDAGLRRVVIGAESGSQDVLDLMKKDTLTGETLISAENLARNGIGALFNFIVGFPNEKFEDTLKTLETIRAIKRINKEFEFGLFFFTPYPGTALHEEIRSRGYSVPTTLAEWSAVDFLTFAGYWIGEAQRRHVERWKFYMKLATEGSRGDFWLSPLRSGAAARIEHGRLGFPVEKSLIEFIRYNVLRRQPW